MRNFIHKILGFLLFINSTCYAILDIEITQGVDTAVPIAVFPFNVIKDDKYTGDYKAIDLSVVHRVISDDLFRSGLFLTKLQEPNYSNNKLEREQIDTLQQDGVEFLIKGNIHINPYDRYQIDVELINLYQYSEDNESTNQNKNIISENKLQAEVKDGQLVTESLTNGVVFKKSFSVSAKYIRNLAHHISDEVFEQLTGIKGIFATRIAYVNVVWGDDGIREYVLEIADSDGFNPQKLLVSSEPIMSPSWRPNGKEIAYVSFAGNRSKINSIELSTGNIKRITSFKGINGAPAWSPDGNKLALVLSKENVPKIYIADLKDNTLKQITKGPAIDTEPRWSPDGKSIIFTSNRGGGPQIYQYNFENRKVSRLTYEGNYNARASFTPDGNKLVMIHRPNGSKGFKIAVQDLTTYNIDVLTDSNMDESPSISANGQQVIYATKESNRGILAEVSIDGRVKIKRPARSGDVQEPAWSPYFG